jgi:hypothetical protein
VVAHFAFLYLPRGVLLSLRSIWRVAYVHRPATVAIPREIFGPGVPHDAPSFGGLLRLSHYQTRLIAFGLSATIKQGVAGIQASGWP